MGTLRADWHTCPLEENMAAAGEQVQCKLDRVCENIDIAKLAEEMVSWEEYVPYCGLSHAAEWEIKENSRLYGVQKRRMLERWKRRSGEDATYRNLAGIFERVGDQMLADFVHKLAHDSETKPHEHFITRGKLAICFFALIALIVLIATICDMFLYQPVKYTQYVDNVKYRYKEHLPDVAQSFWDMHAFVQLSLTSRDKPRTPKVDKGSANARIVSERSMSFADLLSEIDASPGSRIIVVGQPGIGKTTLLQRITRYWAHDKALSSCWILLHIVLRDLVLLEHAPNLTTFLSFMGNTWLPPDIETHVLESDGKGLCFIADGLDEYPAGHEDKTNFIFSVIRAQKLPQSTVVFSSRPEVASHVWRSFNKRVEVLGFGDDQINEYIQEEYGEDKSFSSYLEDHPHIKHTCYIPLHLAMLVYLKDSLLDSTDLPETETEIYEQFIIHTLVWDFCSKDPTSSCSQKNILPTSLNNINESSVIGSLLFNVAKLAYSGIQKNQSIFTKVESILQHTNSSLLVIEKMRILQPKTYTFPHLTIQEFLAAFYFNTYLEQQEQKRVLVEYSNQQTRHVFWKFCCGLKKKKNQTTFLEFFILLYRYNCGSKLPYYCAHEAQSTKASQQLINFTEGIVPKVTTSPNVLSYYDAASFAFVAVSAAEYLLEISATLWNRKYGQFFLHKLCDTATIYSQLRKVELGHEFNLSSSGCLLHKSPNLESLCVSKGLETEKDITVIPPRYGTTVLSIGHVKFRFDNLGITQVKRLLQDSFFLETLSLEWDSIGDYGASRITDLIKALPLLQHQYRHYNEIGRGWFALLWNQSIHNGCNLNLNYRAMDSDDEEALDRLDDFITALVDTVNSGHKEDKSCQLKVRVSNNAYRLLCSDLRDILVVSKTISKKLLEEEVMLKASSNCLEMTKKILSRFEHYNGKDHEPPYMIWFQWISYSVCTFYILLLTQKPRWSLLYLACCLYVYILSSFNYLVQVDSFIFTVSYLWSWIVVGRLIFCVSLKLFSKPWGCILIIAVVVQLYFIEFKLIDYQLFAFLYVVLISGYVLYSLGWLILGGVLFGIKLLISGYILFCIRLLPLWYYLGLGLMINLEC